MFSGGQMYFSRQINRGYNSYIDRSKDDMGTMMDVGLLVMEKGDIYVIDEKEKESAVLLFSGEVLFEYADKKVRASRPDCFHHEAYCLLSPRGVRISLTALDHAEIYIQQTDNERDYEPVMPVFLPGESQGQGSLMSCCLWGRTESDTTEAT